jgi:hypothetical protein
MNPTPELQEPGLAWLERQAEVAEDLAAFPVEGGPVMDALTYADMTTGHR